jgi:fatty acid desaturase
MDSESESYDVHSKSTDMVRPINQGFERFLWTMFIITVIAVFAAALVVAGIIHGGAFYWPLMLFGAIVGSVLLSAAAVPHLRDRSIPHLRGRR